MKKLLFITHESFDDNLVQTQLIPFVKSPLKDYKVYLITFGNKFNYINKLESSIININISWRWRTVISFFLLIKFLIRISPDIIHLRGFNLFPIVFLLKKLMNFKLILDPRGAYPEEILMRFNSRFLYFITNCLEIIYYRTGDLVIFVSNNFKNHIHSKYIGMNIRSVVIPTFYVENPIGLDVDNSVNERNHNDCLNLVYVGSMDVWQKFGSVIDYCNILANMSIRFHLYVITKDIEEASKYMSTAKFSIYRLKSMKPTEISTFLNEMDIAFVFRDFSIVNEVSSPVKIQEYLYSGLFVILSDKIGDLSEFIKTKNLGYLLNTCSSEEVKNSLDVFTQLKEQRNRRESIDLFLSYYNNSIKIENYIINLSQL